VERATSDPMRIVHPPSRSCRPPAAAVLWDSARQAPV
jgi:hypothetical protein